MKTKWNMGWVLLALPFLAIISVIAFAPTVHAHNGKPGIDKAAVYQFVRTNIISKMDGLRGDVKVKMYSRCPSGGFTQRMAENQLNTDGFIYGNILEWKGCETDEFCEYKINMEKNIALLRDKKLTKFQPVASYVAAKKKLLKL